MIRQPDTPVLLVLREIAGEVEENTFVLTGSGVHVSPATLWLTGMHDGIALASADPALGRALLEEMDAIPLMGEDFAALLADRVERFRVAARKGVRA